MRPGLEEAGGGGRGRNVVGLGSVAEASRPDRLVVKPRLQCRACGAMCVYVWMQGAAPPENATWCGAMRRGVVVRCDAMRCDAMRCGAMQRRMDAKADAKATRDVPAVPRGPDACGSCECRWRLPLILVVVVIVVVGGGGGASRAIPLPFSSSPSSSSSRPAPPLLLLETCFPPPPPSPSQSLHTTESAPCKPPPGASFTPPSSPATAAPPPHSRALTQRNARAQAPSRQKPQSLRPRQRRGLPARHGVPRLSRLAKA